MNSSLDPKGETMTPTIATLRSAPLWAALTVSMVSGCYGTVRTRPMYVHPVATATVTTGPAYQDQGVVVYDAPPPPRAVVTVRPAAPVYGAVWVEGQWQWNGAQYVWAEGHWIAPRAGAVYVQPRWERRGRGYVYVQGTWNAGGGHGNVQRRPVQQRRDNRHDNRRQPNHGRTQQQGGNVTVQVH